MLFDLSQCNDFFYQVKEKPWEAIPMFIEWFPPDLNSGSNYSFSLPAGEVIKG